MCKVWFGNWQSFQTLHALFQSQKKYLCKTVCIVLMQWLKSSKKLSWFLISQSAWRDTWHSVLTIQVTICPTLKYSCSQFPPRWAGGRFHSRHLCREGSEEGCWRRPGPSPAWSPWPAVSRTSWTPPSLALWPPLITGVTTSSGLNITLTICHRTNNTTICKNILVQDSEIPW